MINTVSEEMKISIGNCCESDRFKKGRHKNNLDICHHEGGFRGGSRGPRTPLSL